MRFGPGKPPATVEDGFVVHGRSVTRQAPTKAFVELSHLAATILELAGVQAPADWDSRSLVPLLRGQTAAHREDAISEEFFSRMIVTDDYKFVWNDNDEPEIYDRRDDPQEMSNLAQSRPEIVRRLYRTLIARLR